MTPLSGPTPMPEGTPADNPYGFYCYEFDKRKHLERLLAEAVRIVQGFVDAADGKVPLPPYQNALDEARETLARIKAAKEQI